MWVCELHTCLFRDRRVCLPAFCHLGGDVSMRVTYVFVSWYTVCLPAFCQLGVWCEYASYIRVCFVIYGMFVGFLSARCVMWVSELHTCLFHDTVCLPNFCQLGGDVSMRVTYVFVSWYGMFAEFLSARWWCEYASYIRVCFMIDGMFAGFLSASWWCEYASYIRVCFVIDGMFVGFLSARCFMWVSELHTCLFHDSVCLPNFFQLGGDVSMRVTNVFLSW